MRRLSPALLLLAGAALLSACGGETPRPVSASTAPTPAAPAPAPTVNYDTAEYRRSNSAVAANALPAWQAGVSGKGVTIGFVDTGIDTSSAEFAGRISAASRDVTGQDRGITDTDGHGTSIAAVAAAARNDSALEGIAPESTLAVMRADNGNCTDGCHFADAAIAAGIDASIAAGARVINLSLGGSTASQQLREAFRRATAANVVLVMSAGNDALDTIGPLPGAALAAAGTGAIIVVGSVDQNGAISDFSNRAGSASGNYMLALGERVLSIDHQGTQWLMSGTSFAAPAVAAAVALLAQYNPQLTATQIVEILLSTATDAGAAGTDAVYGHGILNIGKAIAPIGATSLAGTATAVPLDAGGTLGSAMGSGLSTGDGLSALPVEDSYGRGYTLNLARNLRPAAASRLAGRLQSAALAQADTTMRAGPFTARLALSATAPAGFTAADAFRDQPRDVESLGFALRGVDARAGARNPLRETRLSLSTGALQLTAASGRQTSLVLPGSAAPGFVTTDGLSPDELDSGGNARLFAAETRHGPLTLALAAATGELSLPDRPGPRYNARQSRVALAAGLDHGPFHLAARLTRSTDDGALLGTRLDPAFGLLGGSSSILGVAAGWQGHGLSLRLAASRGRHDPRLAAGALLRDAGPWQSQSWSADADLALADGLLSLRVAQPLAVTAATLALADGRHLSAAATARETATELGYSKGSLRLATFHRTNAGNQPNLTDTGAALSLRTRF